MITGSLRARDCTPTPNSLLKTVIMWMPLPHRAWCSREMAGSSEELETAEAPPENWIPVPRDPALGGIEFQKQLYFSLA